MADNDDVNERIAALEEANKALTDVCTSLMIRVGSLELDVRDQKMHNHYWWHREPCRGARHPDEFRQQGIF